MIKITKGIKKIGMELLLVVCIVVAGVVVVKGNTLNKFNNESINYKISYINKVMNYTDNLFDCYLVDTYCSIETIDTIEKVGNYEYIIKGNDDYIGEYVTINLKLNKDNSIKEGTTLTYGGMKITKME